MFNFKIIVLFAVLIHCIMSMPTADQDNADVVNDMAAEEHHYKGWGGYYGPYYGGYYGGHGYYRYPHYGGYYGGYWH